MGKSHVTKSEAQAICEYAANLCEALRMPGWNILVMEDPCDKDDAYATVRWIDGKYAACLSLSTEWMTLASEQRRETITHEVLHLLHSRVSTAVLDDSEHLMHDYEHRDWSRRVQREFELMVDHLAQWMSRTHSLEEAWDMAHGKKAKR